MTDRDKDTFHTEQEIKAEGILFSREPLGAKKGYHLQGNDVSTQLESVCKYASPDRCTIASIHRNCTYITQDQWVLETLKEGLRLEFIIQPIVGIKEKVYQCMVFTSHLFSKEINTLLEKDDIEPVPAGQENTEFYSTNCVVPKKQRGLRTILNLNL